MFLSAVWTLILTAPIHCRGSNWWATDVKLNFSKSVLMNNKLIDISDGLRVKTFEANCTFCVNYSFKAISLGSVSVCFLVILLLACWPSWFFFTVCCFIQKSPHNIGCFSNVILPALLPVCVTAGIDCSFNETLVEAATDYWRISKVFAIISFPLCAGLYSSMDKCSKLSRGWQK